MADFKLEEAIRIFQSLPEGSLQELRADPFIAEITDNRDRDFARKSGVHYTKLSLARKLLDLEGRITSRPDSAMYYHVLLGNACYNMTHFGNATEALDFCRDFDGLGSDHNPEYLDCSRALSHYMAAMKLATNAGSKELAATKYYQQAIQECEYFRYYVQGH